MQIDADIAARHASLKAFRRDIHRHPETAFEEVRTAALVAERLAACGIEVHTGLAETGVVGVLRCGDSTRAIGLRADMDALNLTEHNSFDHSSLVP
ncbi:MAG: amidohydrolase, partial [Proteobacteria bacterium]|nr:amidohydrolase [Pseudomonadota bacterium]